MITRSKKILERCDKGISLVAVTIVMLLVAALALVIASMMSSSNISSVIDMQAQQAFYVAEAGIRHVIFKLKDDSDYRDSPTTVSESFGDGSFSVTVSEVDSTYTLTSTGTVDDAVRVIEQVVDVTGIEGGSYTGGAPEAFDYGIHAFGTNIWFKNSTGTITGDVASANNIHDEDDPTINGSVTEDSTVADPSPVDMDGYEDIADNVESGGFVFTSGDTYGASGSEEIWYVQGNTTIQDNVTIYGSVVAEGNITFSLGSSGVSIDAASGYSALISGNNIDANSGSSGLENSTISGLIYADNDVDFDYLAGTTTITGAILAGGDISMKSGGNFTINYDSDVSTNPPPYFNGYSSEVTITLQTWDETN